MIRHSDPIIGDEPFQDSIIRVRDEEEIIYVEVPYSFFQSRHQNNLPLANGDFCLKMFLGFEDDGRA